VPRARDPATINAAVPTLLLLLLCLGAGAWARRTATLPADAHRPINAWVMNLSLPALVFRSIHGAAIDAKLLASASLIWLTFLVPAAIAWVRVRRGGPREDAAIALCAGLPNTAFVGLPLVEALGGRDALGPAAVVDQLGSFLAMFLFAVPWATAISGGAPTFGGVASRLVRAPAMWALTAAIALRGVAVPDGVLVVVGRLADMLAPLALASVGWQLDLGAVRGQGARIAVGLAWRLVAAPALVLAILWGLVGHVGLTERVVVAQAAMAPMVTAGVLAAEYGLAPRLAAALVAVGVPLSLITVPLWWRLLSALE
jgi:hypothetical protein